MLVGFKEFTSDKKNYRTLESWHILLKRENATNSIGSERIFLGKKYKSKRVHAVFVLPKSKKKRNTKSFHSRNTLSKNN